MGDPLEKPSTSRHVPELDGLRGLAILFVVAWHYVGFPWIAREYALRSPTHWTTALQWLWSGVDLFFVLSGFLIGGILLEHREAPLYFKTFFTRRIARTFPLYFLSLALFVVLDPFRTETVAMAWYQLLGDAARVTTSWLYSTSLPLWSYVTFTQNLFMADRNTFGPMWFGISWSLAIEEQFYLLLPFLIRYLPLRGLPYVLAAGCLAAPFLRFQLSEYSAGVLMPCRMDSLFLGVFVAYLARKPRFRELLTRTAPLLAPAFVVLFLAGITLLNTWPYERFNKSWLAVLWAVLLLNAISGPGSFLTLLLRMSWLRFLGIYSYGIYLFHQPVSGIMHGLLRHRRPDFLDTPADLLVALWSFAATLGIAYVLYYLIEAPFIRLGHRMTFNENRRLSPAAGPELEPR